MHRLLLPWLVGLFVVSASSSAAAQYYGEEPELSLYGYRDHTGLFSHIGVGLGYAAASGEDAEAEWDIAQSGVAYQLHFALGGSVMPGLALHFSYFGFDSFGTTLEVNGQEQKGIDSDVSMNGVGAGVTYYLPFNLYFSGAAGISFVSIVDQDGGGFRLDPGLGVQASAGYEWWVSAEWGLGVAVAGTFFRNKDDTVYGDETWTGYAIGPQFSATMN